MDVRNTNACKNQQEIVDNWLDKFGSDYVSVEVEKKCWKRGGCFTDEHWVRKSTCPENTKEVIQKYQNCLPKLTFATSRVPQYPCHLDNLLIEEASYLKKIRDCCNEKIKKLRFKTMKCEREISLLKQRGQTGDLSSVKERFTIPVYTMKHQFLTSQLGYMETELEEKEQERSNLNKQLNSIIKIVPDKNTSHFKSREEMAYIHELNTKVMRTKIGGERIVRYGVADCLMDEMQPEDKKINNQLAIHYQNLVKIGFSEKDALNICYDLRAKVIKPFYYSISIDAERNKASDVAESIFVLKGNGSQISRGDHLLTPFENDGKFCSIDFLKDKDIVIIGPEKAFEKCKKYPVYENLIKSGQTIVFAENLSEEQKDKLGISRQVN